MTHPACDLCKGACCETFVVPISWQRLPPDISRWLIMHGEPTLNGIRVNSPCRALGEDGKCSIYETRPTVCDEYPVGGPACKQAIATRRPKDAAKINKLIKEHS